MYGQHGYETQASYLKVNGKLEEVPYGTKGSTRPDVYTPGESIDIKNYNLTNSTGQSNLVRDVVAQAQTRAQILPSSDVQRLIVDVRGQSVSTATLNAISQRIVTNSNGIFNAQSITFWR
jgi:hypothetical protein